MSRKRKLSSIEKIDNLWLELAGYPLWLNGLKALGNYIELIGLADVEEAVIIAAERGGSRFDRWRYCCGICRSKLAERMLPDGQSLPPNTDR